MKDTLLFVAIVVGLVVGLPRVLSLIDPSIKSADYYAKPNWRSTLAALVGLAVLVAAGVLFWPEVP